MCRYGGAVGMKLDGNDKFQGSGKTVLKKPGQTSLPRFRQSESSPAAQLSGGMYGGAAGVCFFYRSARKRFTTSPFP
jgi:hypothetical protein